MGLLLLLLWLLMGSWKETRGDNGEETDIVLSTRKHDRDTLLGLRAAGVVLVWLEGGADMEVLNSSSSLLVACTNIHSGE